MNDALYDLIGRSIYDLGWCVGWLGLCLLFFMIMFDVCPEVERRDNAELREDVET